MCKKKIDNLWYKIDATKINKEIQNIICGEPYYKNLRENGDDFYMNLLFYHIKLRSYVVIELKTGKFMPEYAGKLIFYISVVDDLPAGGLDNQTIGLLICQSKNNTVVEYSLKDIKNPMGISEYQLTQKLPKEFKSSLPSIEDIEVELE